MLQLVTTTLYTAKTKHIKAIIIIIYYYDGELLYSSHRVV